jgi:hypothetical protein
MKFTFYWKDGTKSISESETSDPVEAYRSLGFTAKDLINFVGYDIGEETTYMWVIDSQGNGEWKRHLEADKKTIIF